MREPKIGLAFGSGGAKGFAHVGVIKVLEEANINIDYVAGSSMGALAAALYGAGHSVESMSKMATTFKRKYYLDFTVPKMGLVAGEKVRELLQVITFRKHIEELSPPTSIVATDLIAGERVVFTEGSAAEAVRASISIPGILVPMKMGDRLFVDGGVIDRVPVSVVRDMGADIVIAADVSSVRGPSEIHSIFDVIMQSIDIMQEELVRHHEISADVMIKPPLGKFNSRTFTDVPEMIRIGEEETRKHLPEIQAAIEKWKG
ncbi:MAG TPA: patatin-like phospholipase family protein [Bacillales bacterium]|nr:patatin-like phospholipase family protein [Bacillales bacterium]